MPRHAPTEISAAIHTITILRRTDVPTYDRTSGEEQFSALARVVIVNRSLAEVRREFPDSTMRVVDLVVGDEGPEETQGGEVLYDPDHVGELAMRDYQCTLPGDVSLDLQHAVTLVRVGDHWRDQDAKRALSTHVVPLWSSSYDGTGPFVAAEIAVEKLTSIFWSRRYPVKKRYFPE